MPDLESLLQFLFVESGLVDPREEQQAIAIAIHEELLQYNEKSKERSGRGERDPA
jgi:hypothetical protein